MAGKAQEKRFSIRRSMSSEPMPISDHVTSERLLARMAARAFARQHPELFGPHLGEVLDRRVSGSPSAARAEAVAPAVQIGDPEKWSVELDDKQEDRRSADPSTAA